MLTPEDFGLSEQHYRINDHQLAESMPSRCPAGHLLASDTVLLGNHPCVACTGSSHRTWRCRECDACWIWPACADRPDWPEWAGVDPEAADVPTGPGNREADPSGPNRRAVQPQTAPGDLPVERDHRGRIRPQREAPAPAVSSADR